MIRSDKDSQGRCFTVQQPRDQQCSWTHRRERVACPAVCPLWTSCWRAARAGRERTGPALRLELALVVRQHSAPGAVRGVARLFFFALSLGCSHGFADDNKAERCKGKAHAQSFG